MAKQKEAPGMVFRYRKSVEGYPVYHIILERVKGDNYWRHWKVLVVSSHPIHADQRTTLELAEEPKDWFVTENFEYVGMADESK